MNFLKKGISLLFVLILTLSLIGCNTSIKDEVTTSSIEQSEVDKTIGKENETDAIKIEKIEESLDHLTIESKVKEESIQNKTVKNTNVQETATDTQINQKQETNTVKKNVSDKKETTTKTSTNTDKSQSNTTKPIETTKSIEKVKADEPTTNTNSVFISINGPKEIGLVLAQTQVAFTEGDSVLDILLKVTKEKDIFVEYRGSGAMAYIEGIDNIYEFDFGPKSGWTFKLNGNAVNKSSDIVKVKKDDLIEWIYTEGKE